MRCADLNVDAAERFLVNLPLLELHEDSGVCAPSAGDASFAPHLWASDKKVIIAATGTLPSDGAAKDVEALCGILDIARAERFLTSFEVDPSGIEQQREESEGPASQKSLGLSFPYSLTQKEPERRTVHQTEFGGWKNQAQLDKMSPGLLHKGLVGGRIVMSIGGSSPYVCSTRPYIAEGGGLGAQQFTTGASVEMPLRHTRFRQKWLRFPRSTAKSHQTGTSYRAFIECSDHQYDPTFLDDLPQRQGKHHTVMRLEAYQVSVIPFLRPQRLKEELNDQFRLNHPSIHPSVTLSKLRNLQKDLLGIAKQLPSLDVSTVAIAWAFFEILVLDDHVRKGNRKLLAGACLVLAYKFHQSGPKMQELAACIRKLDRHDQLNLPTLQAAEMDVFIWLKFGLHLSRDAVENHRQRFFAILGRTEASYYGDQGKAGEPPDSPIAQDEHLNPTQHSSRF